jgi:hypothetical protein
MKRRRSIAKVTLQLALVAILIGLGLNYQNLLDEYALASFHPASQMSAIISRLGLTRTAKATLYRTGPQLDSKTAFNNDCQTTKGELELGCYYRRHVYVLQIENTSLQPEMDVVTAHELLHAAWDRYSPAQRAKLGAELEAAYASLADPELRSRMADYATSEPGQQDNELHSILGTEYANLSPELEAHYARYFASRAPIVAAHAAYKAVFDSRRHELEAELATIRSLKAQLATINRQLEQYRASGQIAQYNALIPKQNGLVDSINSRIDNYQQGVDEYNALSRSLDSQEITDTESNVSH